MEDLPEDDFPEDPTDSEREALVRQYAEEIRERSKIPFIEPLRAWNTVAVRWSLGAGIVLVACAAQAYFLLRPAQARPPRPTAAVLASEAGNPCGQRQAAIVRALASYTKHYGRAPEDLDLLGPPYLYDEPVDPISGRAYEYRHEGGVLIVACPNPGRHALDDP